MMTLRVYGALALFALVLSGCTLSPLVGANCRDEYAQCGNRCVLLQSDPEACGACGIVCGPDDVCRAGVCVGAFDDAGFDASALDGDTPDAFTSLLDSGLEDGDIADAGDSALDTSLDADIDSGPFDSSTVDSGALDSGSVDSGSVDSGSPDSGILDSGPPDSGILDSGPPDSGILDSGPPDTGFADAGDSGELDSGALDAGDSSDPDTGVADSGPPDTGTDAGPLCDLGQLECSGLCVDAISDPSNCGDCGIVCDIDEVCSLGVCDPVCQTGLDFCANRCVDGQNDADNCGGCGVRCTSGICIDGSCSEPVAGHVVVIGHDYTVRRTGMNRIAGNAVFLARGNPIVHAVAWGGRSADAHVVPIDAAIAQVASETGRQLEIDYVVDPSRVPLLLASSDALILYPQLLGTNASLRDLGTQWALALDRFVSRGGVIVLFETSTLANDGTYQILDEAGLFDCNSRAVTSGVIGVVGASDGVAVRVPLTYNAEMNTVSFDTAEGVVVTENSMGEPVVIHRTVLPTP